MMQVSLSNRSKGPSPTVGVMRQSVANHKLVHTGHVIGGALPQRRKECCALFKGCPSWLRLARLPSIDDWYDEIVLSCLVQV